jgi:O-antigen/teichoic acid export membrane protein
MHLRGSSLLVFGRMISVLLNFAVQVVTVRYLDKQDFGALSFALAAASMGASLNLLGLPQAVSRFLPIYQEQRRWPALFGGILFALIGIVGLGVALVALVFGVQDLIGNEVASNPRSLELLLILIALAPVQALDNLFQGFATIFIGARAVFIRRHLLGPGMKLAIVLGVVGMQASVQTLAWCHLIVGVLGLLSYGYMLARAFARQGLLEHFHWREVRMPVRAFLGFGRPLISTDLLLVAKTTLAVMLLEHFHGSTEVAQFRAVVPVAGLCLVVIQSFKFLYVPVASRLLARGEDAALSDLYWKTAVWIAVLTFPVFAACTLYSDTVVVFLFESRYASSGPVLAILTLGNYVNASMGLNAYSLQVFARVRYIAVANLISAGFAGVLLVVLIPRFGSVGAAWSVTAAIAVQNLLNHRGLAIGTSIHMLDWRYIRVYGSILVASAVLWLSSRWTGGHPVWALSCLLLVSLALLRRNRRTMDITTTFPELRRVPLLGRILH